MDNATKVRGARAVLNWEQKELAEAADISSKSVSDIEQMRTTPSSRSLDKIFRAFEKEGISFGDNSIEFHEYPIYFTSGNTHEDAYLKLLDDAYEHLLTVKNPELLIMYADDKVSPPLVNDMYRKMRNAGVKMRQLIKEGNTYIIGPLEEYRYLPADRFNNRVTLIYGDRVANETSDVLRGIVRADKINADNRRNDFEIMWDILPQPMKTSSDERF